MQEDRFYSAEWSEQDEEEEDKRRTRSGWTLSERARYAVRISASVASCESPNNSYGFSSGSVGAAGILLVFLGGGRSGGVLGLRNTSP